MLIDASWHPLVNGAAPSWASGWGEDKFGIFAEFTLGEVEHRLRWVPPGRFMMGSPRSEDGRYGDEGPQHEVVVGEGYWLGSVPVTQSLWGALMDDNPSRFQSLDRPVENVSWNDCNVFIDRLNAKLGGGFRLPSETEWEYACRAGTATSTYAGEMRIDGENNAPVLEDIAWYGGNSGVDFDLDDGEDASGWSEKAHEFDRAGTRPVGQKQANPWGIYDMLGNVWEWCEDDWHDGYKGAPADGSAWIDEGDRGRRSRVIRGGSWSAHAHRVRAAFRLRYGPGLRSDFLGFRLARVR